MEKKKKIIIGVAIAVIAIIAVIVGITVGNHQKAVKEAESISVSIEASKTDLITSYKKQFDEITSKNYSTKEDYSSAKELLESLKKVINDSNVKDNEEIVNLVKDIDKSIKDYDDKIKSLTTTEESTTKYEETTTKSNSTEKTTKSNNNTNNSSNDSYKDNKPKSTTTKETTKKETTTKKKNYKPAPAYGTVVTSKPNPDDYEEYQFHSFAAYYTWEDGEWYLSHYRVSGGMDSSTAYNYASPYISEPNRNGKYEGEEVKVLVWIWG